MFAGMRLSWRANQPKQKRCHRCGLYCPESIENCIHCAELNDAKLAQFKEQYQETLQNNSTFGKYILFVAAIIGILLLLSFL